MAKRFIDTGLFDDDWFMDLSKDAKILYLYLITKCTHAGLIKLNEKLCKVQTGITNLTGAIEDLGNRLVTVKEGFFFMPKFLYFQYPNFPNSKVFQQKTALEELTKLGLFNNSSLTLNEGLSNPTVNVNDSVNENGNEKKTGKCLMKNSGITQQVIYDSFQKTNDLKLANPQYYYNTALAWSDSKGELRIDWIATVANFARRDLKDGKMQLMKKYRTQTEAAPDNFGEFSKETTHMPQSLRDKYGIK